MNWLLLRGLAREQRHWGDFPETLARLLGHRVHCLDLPGTGTEHERPSPTSIEAMAEDVRSRWQALRQDHPGAWRLLGISMGGMLSMHWAATHPDDFDGVVLLNTSASNLSRPWERMGLEVVPGVLRSLFESDPVRRERRILGFTTRLLSEERAQAIATRWATFQSDHPVARTTVVRQLRAASRYRAPVSLPIPALVICAAEDSLANPRCGKRLADHFRAPLVVHPTAGHDLPLDDPDWLATQIREWAAGLPSSEPAERTGTGDSGTHWDSGTHCDSGTH